MSEEKITLKDLKDNMEVVSENEMYDRYEDFLKYIEDNDFKKIPSKSAFADFMGVKRSQVYKWFAAHPFANEKIKAMTADTITAGAMLKKYVPNVSSFALKNLCGWEESPKAQAQTGKTDVKEKKASAALEEYIKQQRISTPIVVRGEKRA